MAISLTHSKVSAKIDGADSTLVQPSDWNAEHGLTAGANVVLGTTTAGAVTEISCTAAGRALIDDADATAQRATLGLVIGTNVQAQDAELSAIAGLTSAADSAPYFTGSGAAALMTVTSAARTVLDDTTTAAMLTTLGAQPLDTELTALASTTSAADKAPYFTGAGTASTMTVTAAARTVLDDTSTGAMLTTLGAAASGAATSSGLTMATSRILGRTTASTGAIEEITVGSGLSLSGGSLTATSGSLDVQTFTSSGTWTKPASGSWARVQLWGGGGSGRRDSSAGAWKSGGCGGHYLSYIVPLSALNSTETVTVGAGGAARSGSNQNGEDGGNSYINIGGSAGPSAQGGKGGVNSISPSNYVTTNFMQNSSSVTDVNGSMTMMTVTGSNPPYVEGRAATNYSGSESSARVTLYAGGGGGVNATWVAATPWFTASGAGGAGNDAGAGTNGSAPAGGGGAGTTTSGAGGDGKVIITVW